MLIFLTPVFSKLPYNCLGAIVCSSVTGLLEYEQAIYLWKVRERDDSAQVPYDLHRLRGRSLGRGGAAKENRSRLGAMNSA